MGSLFIGEFDILLNEMSLVFGNGFDFMHVLFSKFGKNACP